MMKKQSLDFIKGYVFSKVEDRIISTHTNKVKRMPPVYVRVPKTWFGLRPLKTNFEDLSTSDRSELLASLGELCHSYNTEDTTHIFFISIYPDEQYIRFTIEGGLLSAVKEMTVSDIEKELGYKIKIIG